MNKKLMAVAVAGALAVPGIALAQTTVTISGIFKVGMDNISINSGSTNAAGSPILANGTAVAGGGRTNRSEWRVSDNSSRIIFGIREDLGNGLAAVAQLDTRFAPPSVNAPTGNGAAGFAAISGGNTWVGIDSTSWGRVTLGSHDLHYGKGGDSFNTSGPGSLQMWSSSLFDSLPKPVAGAAGASGQVVAAVATGTHSGLATQSRTREVIRWDTPNWNGFSAIVAWSANPLCPSAGGSCVGGDLGSLAVPGSAATATGSVGSNGLGGVGPNVGSVISRKGDGWNINPSYKAANWGVEYSYWNAKADVNNQTGFGFNGTGTAGWAVQDDQRSDVLAGYYTWGGLRVGLAWNKSKTTSPATGLITGDRQAWVVPVSYTTGPHTFAAAYTRANDSKDITATTGTAAARGVDYTVSGANTGANMWTVGYGYDLSKRTALGLSYGRLQNKSAANYSFFYNSQTAFGSANAGANPGEQHTLFAATIRHNF